MQQTSSIDGDSTQSMDNRTANLLSQMNLIEKIGQMTQVEKDSITPEAVTTHAIGSVLSGGGGNPEPNNRHTWREMVQGYVRASLQTRLKIPLIYGVDAVHGHNNLTDATIFPHNIGLGAANNPGLMERIAEATAREMQATNVHWNFAPAVSVPQDIRWGRAFEGFSEDSERVTRLGLAYLRGLRRVSHDGLRVLESVKHFAGDGGTEWDSRGDTSSPTVANWQAASENWRIDQGDTRTDEATLREIHLKPYKAAVEAGALNIMVSFSSWNGLKLHAHEYLLTQVLKQEWGFEGFLVSDWMAINQISTDFYECVVRSINAGLDMIMVPYDYEQFIDTLTAAVNNGDVPLSRIDDAVSRILRVKFELGLFENPFTDESLLVDIGSEAHREIARDAVHQSQVLLKNEENTLPLQVSQQIAVIGEAADDIGLACGGWTIEWQGGRGAITAGKTLLDGIRAHADSEVVYVPSGDLDTPVDTAVVVIAETPYAEGEGDRDDLTVSDEDVQRIQQARSMCQRLVLVIYSGRPLIITPVVDSCDAIVAAWLPGSEADAVADNLFGAAPFGGKLSFNWPRSMQDVPSGPQYDTNPSLLWERDFGLTL